MEQPTLFDAPTLDGPDPASLCTDEERRVLAALGRGAGNARKVSELAVATGIHSRRVQEIVHHLLLEHRAPIASSMGEPYGNYLIATEAELEATVALLRTRGLSSLERAAALRRMSTEALLAEVQTELGAA